jgi:hypothetical protein
MNGENNKTFVVLWVVGILVVVVFITILMFLFPMWNVWRSGLSGEADLKRAEQTRMIQIQQAKGEMEAASLRAQAIAIVGQAAKDFPEYRQQEFIGAFAEAMHNGRIHQIIYVPTEGNIPITETARLHKK